MANGKQVFFTINSDTKEAVKSIKELEDEIKRLRTEWKNTEDPIARNKISESLKSAKTELNNFNNTLKEGKSFSERITSSISEGFTKIGGAIAGTFAVEKIVEFGAESVKAFTEAEKNAKLLETAVGVNGGLSEDFDRLIQQSSDLQDITIFSDDDIQKVQTAALQFGLTADQVEKLTPIVTDFASATGQDLNSALSAILSGVNGAAKGLKQYGISLQQGQTAEENFNDITEQLNKKFKDQGQIVGETASGGIEKLKNKYDDIKETVGEFVLSLGDAVANMGLFVLNGFKVEGELDDLKSSFTGTKEELDKLGSGILDFQIQNLQNQINLGVGDVRKLQDQLEKLQAQKFSVTIDKLNDTQLLKQISDLQKKQGTFNFSAQDSAYLKALKAAAEQRKLDTTFAEKDLTKLSLNELKNRQSILLKQVKDGNNKFAESSLESVNQEIQKRTDASAKAAEKAKAQSEKEAQDRQATEDKINQLSQQAYELSWKNKIDTAKEGSEKLQAQADKAAQDRLNFDAQILAKEIEIGQAKTEGEANLAKAQLDVLKQQRKAADNEANKYTIDTAKARIDETTQLTVNAIQEETANKIDGLQKQLEAAKGNSKEERRINLEITKTKIDGQIKENQAIINSLNEKKAKTGTLTKEEEKQAKEAADKIVQLNKDKNAAINADDEKSQKERFDRITKEIQIAADITNQIVNEVNRKAQEDIQNRLALSEKAKTDRLAQLDAEYQKEKSVRGESEALNKKYFDKKKKVEEDYEKARKKLELEAWKRQKAANLSQAIIGTAVAVINAVRDEKGDITAKIAAGILAGAAGAVQIGIIASQKAPQFQQGGILYGPSHSQGGIPLYGSGGRVFGEAEGGEIILTKNVSKSPELLNLASAINYAAGGRRFDRGGIVTPVTKFATGGVLDQAIGNNFNDLNATLASINRRLAEPPRAYVVEQEFTSVQNKNALIERRSKIA